MTAQDILNIINADEETIYGCAFYGIRADHSGIQKDERLENSHQWWADDPSNWGEECEYNEALGQWDGGELDGTCTVGIKDYCPTIDDVKEAIERARSYIYGNSDTLYLVRGTGCEGGNDIGESIIHNARCVGEIR